MALTSNGKWLATGTLDNRIRLWDLSAVAPVGTKTFDMPRWPSNVFFGGDNTHLVALSGASDIVLFDIGSGKEVKSWKWKPRKDSLFGVGTMYVLFSAAALASDGKHLVFSNHTPHVAIMRLPVKR
jgi:WD40 repeat protein